MENKWLAMSCMESVAQPGQEEGGHAVVKWSISAHANARMWSKPCARGCGSREDRGCDDSLSDDSRALAVRAWFVMTASPVWGMEKYKQK